MSRGVSLVSRPNGIPKPENFALVQEALEPLRGQEVLVRNRFFSVDPYMRGRMNPGKSYITAFELGRVVEGAAVGEVVASNAPRFKAGDTVLSNLGWRDLGVAAAGDLRQVDGSIKPLSTHLGILGMTGMTAWVGMNLAEVKAGETVFVSGAAGAVGHVAGQLAKLRGCRVIGSTGSISKAAFLRETCGFDSAFVYKVGPILEQLNYESPEGVDVYFDNVGGEALEAALAVLRPHGRIVICGGISGYNAVHPHPGPANLFNVVVNRLTIKGFIVRDWLDRRGEFEAEVGGFFRAGKIKSQETVVVGIERAAEAFIGLFHGQNMGKLVVQLGPENL